MVAASVGTPGNLQLNFLDFAAPGDEHGSANSHPVSVLDPATGQLTLMPAPPQGTEECYRFWKPVFDEMLPRIKARGWLKETTLGFISQFIPPPPSLVSTGHRIWPEGEWSWASHGARLETFPGLDTNVVATIRHADNVFIRRQGSGPSLWSDDKPRRYTFMAIARGCLSDNAPLWYFRRYVEALPLSKGGLDGVCAWGLDLFPLKRPVGGYFVSGHGRGSNWGGWAGNPFALLYPGPDGAVATERYEAFREGIELCEAIIFVRTALEKKRISGDLAERASRYLDGGRSRGVQQAQYGFWRMQADEDAKLLDLAGEVAREIEGKK